jgi:hypothetical protein
MSTTEIDELAATAEAKPSVRTYGNWRRTQSPGLWGLGTGATFTLLGLCGAGLLVALTLGIIPALAWELGVAVVAVVLLWRDFSGRPYSRTAGAWIAWKRADREGATSLVQGPLAPVKDFKLPGVLRYTKLSEWADGSGRLFSLLTYRNGMHTVPFECRPDGTANVDQPDIDQMVARFGLWEAQLSELAGLVAAEFIVETSPDTGKRLAQALDTQEAPSASPVAKVVMTKVAAEYPASTATIRTWGSVTFSEKVRLGVRRDRSPEARTRAMAESLAPEIPHLINSLRGTGAGRTTPIDQQGLCEIVRVSYDPDAADALDAAVLDSRSIQALNWDQVGPVAQHDGWDVYRHDGCHTITHVMTVAPRSIVHEDFLNRLMEPTPGIMRKRVAIKLRPLPLEKAGDAAEKDHSTALFQRNAAAKKTARHHGAVRAAEQSAAEVAGGAGLSDFVVVTSMTVGPKEDLRHAVAQMRILTATARLRTRRMYAQQGLGFAASLPVGFDPVAHMSTSGKGRK